LQPADGTPPIRFQRPTLPAWESIAAYLERSREARWFSNGGPCWHLLRDRLADRVGAYCIPVANGTIGLMAAIAAVLPERGAGSAQPVALMPSFTFPATPQAALWAGARPRLLDIDARHWHLDPDRLERALADEAGGSLAVAVSAFGTPPPPDTRTRWERVCRAAEIPLVVDSAAGFGAVAEDDTPIGRQGDVEVVSFHATKPFAVGEGGAVFTGDRRLRERIELTINFGLARNRSATLARALNGKMSELHAATGLAVLDEFDAILDRRRSSAARIRAESTLPIQWQQGCTRSTWQFVPVAFPDAASRRAARASHGERAELRTYYEPLHQQPAFSSLDREADLSRTTALHERILCLPMANDLTDAEIDTVGAILRSDAARTSAAASEHAPAR
jgi:dTDP-4-amino-4,6-dideoxygalactose transaminase